MKKQLSLIIVLILFSSISFAQRFAFVDTKYILKNIPSYNAAQEKLDKMSEEWQAEIEKMRKEVEEMYKTFQAERVLLTEEMKKQREDEIIEKEREVRELQNNYFGMEGKLYQKRQELIQPIQDEVYNAIKQLSEKSNYAIIFDSASGSTILYTDPGNDKSDEVLEILGYTN
jgi:outer membrane protein